MDILKKQIDSLRDDLDNLNREWRDMKDSNLSANQCYHFESDPPHFLFNTNCPDSLREKLNGLLDKYFPKKNDLSTTDHKLEEIERDGDQKGL